MAIFLPFQAVRPTKDKVALVSSKSYEAYSPAELGAKLNFNPYSFLHVLNPGYQFQQQVAGEQRYNLVRKKYLEFKNEHIFIQDEKPCFYVYEYQSKTNNYCGFIGACSVEDYENNIIKKHEGVIKKRVVLFEKYLKATGFNAEPVLLTFEDEDAITNILNIYKNQVPEYEFSTTDQILHKLWVVKNENDIALITKYFVAKQSLYIADGHHRSASSLLLSKELNKDGNVAAKSNFFMSYLIPESQLKIDAFNRFVTDLNGLTVPNLLQKISSKFEIINKGKELVTPSKKHEFVMYVDGNFYVLKLKKDTYKFSNELSYLDAEILFQTILKPILGIKNLDHNQRISYTHQTQENLSLKNKVDTGLFAVGFSLLPTTIKELKAIADANLQMPPKTTYILPKLRSALTLYEF